MTLTDERALRQRLEQAERERDDARSEIATLRGKIDDLEKERAEVAAISYANLERIRKLDASLSVPETCISCEKPGQIYKCSRGFWCNWCGAGWSLDDELSRSITP